MTDAGRATASQHEDLCYYGFVDPVAGRRIVVERSTYGLTERQNRKVLRELQPIDPVITFHWGYTGSGPNSAARAILVDALGFEPSTWVRHAFVWDFLGLAGSEFSYRRATILRWLRGLCIQKDKTALPPVLVDLPPVSPREFRLKEWDLEDVEEGPR